MMENADLEPIKPVHEVAIFGHVDDDDRLAILGKMSDEEACQIKWAGSRRRVRNPLTSLPVEANLPITDFFHSHTKTQP